MPTTKDIQLVMTVELFRNADGSYVARGLPNDRDAAEAIGKGATAEEALAAVGKDYDAAPPFDHETVKID